MVFPLPFRHLFSFLAVLSLTFAQEEKRPPNILIFLTDDQGWGDLSLHGNPNLETPHLDSLAREGASFANFYVCAVCAPTRAEFLTGRYHPKTGVSGVSEGSERLNPDEITIADLFQEAGYATGIFGKWHNGTQSPYHPLDRGFDEFYGFTSGHWGHYFSPPLDANRKRVKGEGYLPDDLTNKALAFIEANRDRPFFCYVPYNTPHSPFYVDDDFFETFRDFVPTFRHRDPEKEDIPVTRAALAM
ncbi:MAG: sulfatase-like hydrolase/transferase, partial [Verrucomicrobiota bacterium]